MKKIAFFGGDERTLSAMNYLTEAGYCCVDYGVTGGEEVFPEMEGSCAAVFPLPCERNGRLNAPRMELPPTVSEVWVRAKLPEDTPVFSGFLKNAPFPRYTDLSVVTALKERNAVTTVEGVLPLLIGRTGRSLCGARCLIVGWGALGKRLAQVLTALGVVVTASARKEADLRQIAEQGLASANTERLDLSGFSIVINTVPSPVMGDLQLRQTGKDTLLVELASAPGGFDPEALRRCDRRILRAPGLPGVVAPVTAGEDLAKTLIELWRDKI